MKFPLHLLLLSIYDKAENVYTEVSPLIYLFMSFCAVLALESAGWQDTCRLVPGIQAVY